MAFADDNGQRMVRPFYNGPPSAYPGQGSIQDTGPPAAPAQQDFGAYLRTDPGYAALHAALGGQLNSDIVGFGDATGLTDLNGNPIDSATATAAANNPYSWLAQDRHATQQHLGGINNNANAHGLLFSGANAQGQVNEYSADQVRNYTARQALSKSLQGYGAQDAGGLSQANTNYLLAQPKPTLT